MMITTKPLPEQTQPQAIPVNIYSINGRVMVSAPMPGLEAENITIEVTEEGHLRLQGELRGTLKEHDGKERFLDEWTIGGYAREVVLPVPVNAACANASYGNGVLVLAFPRSSQTTPARLGLKQVAPAHGQQKGNAGHPPSCGQRQS